MKVGQEVLAHQNTKSRTDNKLLTRTLLHKPLNLGFCQTA